MSMQRAGFEEYVKLKHCNWTYTGEFNCNNAGQVMRMDYTTECGKYTYWTRYNKVGRLFEKYEAPFVQGTFNVRCPYCEKLLNIYNPYDDGETWLME